MKRRDGRVDKHVVLYDFAYTGRLKRDIISTAKRRGISSHSHGGARLEFKHLIRSRLFQAGELSSFGLDG